jgi:hypothetical protein
VDPRRARAAIDRYAAIIAGKAVRDDFDGYAVGQLAERRALLEAVWHEMPGADAWWEPAGWAHGDFHDLNVLWHGGTIAAGRLDPPMVLVLDEAANICRIADLPDLYSHLGSRGMVPVTILQSYQQGVSVWGEPGMAAQKNQISPAESRRWSCCSLLWAIDTLVRERQCCLPADSGRADLGC